MFYRGTKCVYFYMTRLIDKNNIYIYMIYDIYFLILYTQSGNPANLLEYIAERGPDSAYAVHWAKNALYRVCALFRKAGTVSYPSSCQLIY